MHSHHCPTHDHHQSLCRLAILLEASPSRAWERDIDDRQYFWAAIDDRHLPFTALAGRWRSRGQLVPFLLCLLTKKARRVLGLTRSTFTGVDH
ncbi:hypothetical protein NL676_005795 [Syzygium grande]|nr:hypothetical protein NL676_005795 [Syzygium grande]